MQKPNVLFISSWYPSEEHPTLGNFVQRHAEAINPFVNLYVVSVTSSNKINEGYEVKNQIINGVNTTLVYYPKVHKKGLLGKILKFKRYKQAFGLGIKFFKEDISSLDKFDLVHCNVTFPSGLIALDLKKKLNIPYILTEHWTLFLPYKNEYQELPFYVKNRIKRIVAEAERVVPVSYHLAKSMKEKGLQGNYEMVPNVADINRFELKHESDNETKKILHVSTLIDDHKNISGIFKALKDVSKFRQDFKLVVVSDGDIQKAKELQEKTELSAGFVEYHGTKTPEEIAKFYRNADFFLLFSNYENLPVVISESHCCGLPVISSSVGGIPEMIDNENGILVEPNNESQLSKAIMSLLDNLEKYDAKLIRSKAIKRYDNSVVGKQYFEIYKSILK